MNSGTLYASLFLAQVAFVTAVDVETIRIKAIGGSGNKYRFKGRCTYAVTLERPVAAESVWLTIQLDRPTYKFSSNQVTELSNDETAYLVTNTEDIEYQNYKVTFKVDLECNETKTNSCIPIGTCSELRTEEISEMINPGEELFQNSDMESDFTDNWFCKAGCTLDSSNDSYSGNKSAKITNRDRTREGLAQWVNLTPGSRYQLSGYVKLLNTETGENYHKVEMVLFCDNDTEVKGGEENMKFGTSLMVHPHIWFEVGAVLPISERCTSFMVFLVVSGATVDYLVDQMSIREIPDIIDWKLRAKATVKKIRQADISINLISSDPLPENLTLEVTQKNSEFAFGSAVGAEEIVDDEDPVLQKYQDFFYDHFEWTTLHNALKWKPMEKKQGEINYDRPMNAINALRSRGIKIRGHSVFWGIEKNTPTWVNALNQTELLAAMSDRINGVVNKTAGLLQHWDVNNEHQHGDYYERRTGDANVTMNMFNDVRSIDPDVKLFFNDYAIIETRGNQKATAIKEHAKLFKAANVTIYGIGIQSHIKRADLDITSMKTRLNKLDEAGIAIWVTELTVEEDDENKKARAMEDALTLYFSHPTMEGTILWGFWEGKMAMQNQTLVKGPDMTPNAAGRVVQRLFKEEWRTKEVLEVIDTNLVKMRGFKGEYFAELKQNGEVLKSANFTLGSDGAEVDFTLP